MTEFWTGLTPAERQAYLDGSFRRRWRRGEPLFHQGDNPDWVALLHTGHVKVCAHTPNGDDVVLAICGPGTLIGDVSALDGLPRSATVAALDDVAGSVMPGRVLRTYLHQHAGAAEVLRHTVARRLRDADRTRMELSVRTAADRLAARLIELAERFGTPRAGTIHIGLQLSQEDLARWAGSSREAVTKTLSGWRRRGWIRTGRRSVTILDPAALRHAGPTAAR
ncbi:Crp/Fnr family transcriptional regulator [Actinomycetes bacterium KLBMP 9797]